MISHVCLSVMMLLLLLVLLLKYGSNFMQSFGSNAPCFLLESATIVALFLSQDTTKILSTDIICFAYFGILASMKH